MRRDRARRLRGDVDLLADEGGQRRPAAAIRHVQELDAGGLLEHLERHVRRAVVAGRAERDLAGPLLGVGDEIGDRLPRRVGCARRARRDRPARARSARTGRARRRACGRRAARPPAGTSSTTAPSGACGRRARRAPPTALPSMPPAPERLSTTTDLPRIFSSASATGRAARSACPPGGNATIMVMLRVGQACAPARATPSAPTIGAASAPCRNLRRSMATLPDDSFLGRVSALVYSAATRDSRLRRPRATGLRSTPILSTSHSTTSPGRQ